MARVVRIGKWTYSGLYDRDQKLEVLEGGSTQIAIAGIDYDAGGVWRALSGTRYSMLVDGEARGHVDVKPGEASVEIVVDLAGVAEGWVRLSLDGLTEGETAPTWFAYRYVDGKSKPAMMPVVTGTFDLYHAHTNIHAWGMVPTDATPIARPLERTEYPPFSATLKRDQMVMDQLVICHDNNLVNLPNVNSDGIVNTFNVQGYHYWNLHKKYPVFHLLDGPRGVAQTAMITHMSIGLGTVDALEVDPNSPSILALYATDPWRFMRIDNDGKVKTLAGYRHKGRGPYHDEAQPGPTLELVGDWSAIPEARRGFTELWGLAWIQSTLTTDTKAPRIPQEDNRQPHVGNPACLLADTQNNRICKVTFDGKSHATPAKVTEWVTGLGNPWDVVRWRDQYIVGERSASKIVAYDEMGNVIRTVLQRDSRRPGNATISTQWEAVPVGTTAEIQAQPVVAPEGLYVLDDWLYYGSRVMQQVRRVHLETGEVQVVCTPYGAASTGQRWMKIAVSDGTFGPRGTVFVQAWMNASTPHQEGYLPDGTRWSLYGSRPWSTYGYGNAVAVGHGRLYTASSEYGVQRFSKKLTTDLDIDYARFERGRLEYKRMHGRLLWGPDGYSHWGYALPWGQSAELDYYLIVSGRKR